ncbi:hypothetical protein EIP86_005848 [Pleurotus ostreatoroseus]|nr:hypothetical protein EIP86_005848 [Pleurotus ostreatoroseus]
MRSPSRPHSYPSYARERAPAYPFSDTAAAGSLDSAGFAPRAAPAPGPAPPAPRLPAFGPQAPPRVPIHVLPALLRMPVVELPIRHSALLRVTERAGLLGISDKVEWRLLEQPQQPIRPGLPIAFFDHRGYYRGISRTVGKVVGFDRYWVTFILSSGRSASATVQTLTVPAEHAALPLLLRIVRALLLFYLPDEHPYESTSLPILTPLRM